LNYHNPTTINTHSSFESHPVINSNCSGSRINFLNVVATQIPASFIKNVHRRVILDINGNNTTNNDKRDSIASLILVKTDIRASLPPGNYIRWLLWNQTDALAELNVITRFQITEILAIQISQDLGRVDSDVDTLAVGLGSYVAYGRKFYQLLIRSYYCQTMWW
jgi:hypothetical protein